MSADIHCFPTGKVSVDALLEMAKRWEATDIIMLGWDKDGELIMSSSFNEKRDIMWLLECARNDLLNG